MPTKKKTFDAVAESRRWRIAAGKRLGKMTFAEQQVYLQQVAEAFFAGKPHPRAAELAKR